MFELKTYTKSSYEISDWCVRETGEASEECRCVPSLQASRIPNAQ
jgi:hypothetical protein